MAQSRSKARLYLGIAGATMALFIGIGAILSQGPDRDLIFVRDVPVESTRAQLDQAMDSLIQWPQWFYNIAEVQRVDLEGKAYPLSEQQLLKGARLLLKVDPKKGAHRKFEILTEVTQFEPGKLIELLVIQDSKGKLARMFDRLTWRVEVIPAEEGQPLRVRGTGIGHTRHWRARLFGRLAERILMSQAFYPDVIKLGSITRPQVQNPHAVY